MIVDELIAILGYDVKGEGELNKFNRGLDRAQRHAERFANRINTLSVAFGTFLGQMAAQFAQRIGQMVGALPSDILKVGQQFENLGVRLETLEGSAEKGQAALEWVRKFAETTPLDLAEAANAYANLKNFGIDPMNGSLQALTDAMAASGQGTQNLKQLTLALGQAWAKGKLQGQEILQFINAGIPVWEMLSKVTGKNAAELQKLSEKGQLGRDVIQKLTDEIGRRYAGAGDKMAKTQQGVLDHLGDQWTMFLKKIADSGYYDYITRKLKTIQDAVEAWAKDGTMARWAKSISNGLIRAIQAAQRWGNGLVKVFGWIGQYLATFWRDISMGNVDLSKWQALAVAAGILLAVFAPMTAAVLAVILVLDDFFAYLNGGQSYIGDFVNFAVAQWKRFAAAVSDLYTNLVATISGYFDTIRDIVVSAFDIDLSAIGAKIGRTLLNGLITVGKEIRDWFGSLIPDWAKAWFAETSAKAEAAKNATSLGAAAGASVPSIRSRAAAANSGGNQFGAMLQNMDANMAKLNPANAANATLNDNRQDNRNQSTQVSVGGVQVNVQSPASAPAAVGRAVGQAVGRAAVPPSGRLAIDSAF